MPFRFDGQFVFLTYPHSDLAADVVHSRLSAVGPLAWLRVCKESHADGSPHCHALAKFSRRVQSRNERVFDIDGRHPHIERPRDTRRALAYVAKDGEFTDFGEVPTESPKRTRDEALALADGPDEAAYLLACLDAKIPFQYAKRYREIKTAVNENVIDALYEACLAWECPQLQELSAPENKCAVLVGPTGCGKTAWACRMAPKPALWVTHIDVLRQFNPRHHRSIIFDDMSFKHMPEQAQIHLTDWDRARQIHCRYGHATIPANTPKFFTCNEYPFSDDSAPVRRRIVLIDLY